MHIFLDYYREPDEVTWGKNIPLFISTEWVVVRNYAEFVALVESLEETPKHIAFDHDLADAHYVGDFSNPDEKTGLDCAKKLVEICMERKWLLPEFSSHSLNPVGRENIIVYLENAKKFLEDDGS